LACKFFLQQQRNASDNGADEPDDAEDAAQGLEPDSKGYAENGRARRTDKIGTMAGVD